MKLHKTIIAICLLLIGIFVFFLTQRSGAQEQNQQAQDIACEVNDIATLKDCVQKAKDGKYNLIKITAMLACTTKDDCAMDFTDLRTSLKIYGISNSTTGFKRTGQFDYSLFTLKNSKDLTIGSFLIDDSSIGDCFALGTPCPPVIVVEKMKDSSIDQLNAIGSKDTTISIVESKNITVKNSSFTGSQNHNIVVRNGDKTSSDIILVQNIFTDTYSNAVIFSSYGGENSIKNNTFRHNHIYPIYNGCVGYCSASQLLIMPLTQNVVIENNTIRDGSIRMYTDLGMYASGIEIAPQLVEKITLRCNTIFNNTGNGIVIPERTTSTSQIIMKQNKIYNNGININFYTRPDDDIQNNCFDASCKVDGCN